MVYSAFPLAENAKYSTTKTKNKTKTDVFWEQ